MKNIGFFWTLGIINNQITKKLYTKNEQANIHLIKYYQLLFQESVNINN